MENIERIQGITSSVYHQPGSERIVRESAAHAQISGFRVFRHSEKSERIRWGYKPKTIGLRMGVQFSHSLADGKNRIAVKLQLTGKSRLTFQFYSTISPRS